MDLGLHIATDGLKTSLEGNFGSLVELIDPDGNPITKNEDGNPLKGQVLYERENEFPETGDDLVVNEHQVTLRKTALSRVPISSETWKVAYPLDKSQPTVLTTHIIDEDHAITDGASAGWVKLYPREAEQN